MQTSFCTAKKEIVIVYNTSSKKLIAPLRDNYANGRFHFLNSENLKDTCKFLNKRKVDVLAYYKNIHPIVLGSLKMTKGFASTKNKFPFSFTLYPEIFDKF